MLGVWDKILVGLQHVRAIAHLRQVLDLLSKTLTRFNRPSSTGKAKDFAKDGAYRFPEPTFGFSLGMNVQS